MNPAAHRIDDNASGPVLYMAPKPGDKIKSCGECQRRVEKGEPQPEDGSN